MTILDRVNTEAKAAFNMLFDKEPINHLEAAGLYSVIAQGRLNKVALEVIYNHAQDPELRKLIREAIEEQTGLAVEQSEAFLAKNGGTLPELNFSSRTLHAKPLDIPADARFSDYEIVLALATMAKVSQMALLAAMHNSYQPHIGNFYRKHLDSAFNFNLRLAQFALERGWLPPVPKVHH